MSSEEIKDAIGGYDKTSPIIRAIAAWLALRADDESDAVCAPTLDDARRHFDAGRLANARDTATIFNDLVESLDKTKKGVTK